MTLRDRIHEEIRASGPMPFERYMARALYDANGGFFGSGPLRSVKAGDFLTSPEVSPWFGRTLARFVAQQFERLEPPHSLFDVGAGSGTLLRALIDALDPPPDEIHAVDASPAARRALESEGFAVSADLSEIASPCRGVIVANELLDNLPMRLAVRSAAGWEERWVATEGSGLALVPAEARTDTLEWLDAYAGPVAEGGLVEVQLAAGAWLAAALEVIESGALVVFDYGGTAEELAPRRTAGTLRTYRAHHLGPDPLLEPGRTDITADVNFTALCDVAARDAIEVRIARQDDFLAELGLRATTQQLRRRELELAATGDPMERLAVRSELKDAETLLHPRGLGDFRVLVAIK